MKEFHSNKEVVFGSKLYCSATEFLLVRSRREMWAAIRDKKKKFQWLKLMFERRSNIKPWCKCKSAIMYLHLFIFYFLAIEVDCVFICFFLQYYMNFIFQVKSGWIVYNTDSVNIL
jgi:hypothetical protein